MSCAGCTCDIPEDEEAYELFRDKMYCHSCVLVITPKMKRYIDSTTTGE